MLNPFESTSSSSEISYDESSEAYRDSKLEAAIRWIIYAINFVLAIVGQCVIFIGLVLTDTVGLVNPDKLGYNFRGIVYLFVITGVVTILISITGGGWFSVHQSLLIRIHLGLTVITILLYLIVITVIAIRSTADNAALYLSRCWDDYVIRNKTIDLMELQIRFKCCGQNNISDYIEYDYVLKMSCYENFNQLLKPFESNCRIALKEFFIYQRNITILISSFIIIMMMKRGYLEILLWVNHLQTLELAILGITLIMAGCYIPFGLSHMKVELVCYCDYSVRNLYIASGAVKVVTAILSAFWYRKHMDVIHLFNILLLALCILLTITMAIILFGKCNTDIAKDKIESLWISTAYNNDAFFMVQQHLECCGKTGASDYIEEEMFPVCHRNFDKNDRKFTVGCIKAAQDFYNLKEVETVIIASILASMELKCLAVAGILFKNRKRIAALSIHHAVTYIR